jgi:hypothetical protein
MSQYTVPCCKFPATHTKPAGSFPSLDVVCCHGDFDYISAQPKILENENREITIALGRTINKTCSATGNPLPDVVWTRTKDPNREILKRGKGRALLVVKDVQEKDLGNYTCNATNSIKSDIAVFTIKGK